MASVSTYFNFDGNTEEAFNFYASVFGNEITSISRMRDMPTQPGDPEIPEALLDKVINVSLQITGDHWLMGTDAIADFGHPLTIGNDVSVCLMPDTREEADRLFAGLSEGGRVEMPMAEMFWGDYYGAFADKFGKMWMINTSAKS